MTLPMAPPPRLSVEATPIVLPSDPPSLDVADRQFSNGAVGERDLLEREMLGHAMGSEAGVAELRKLDPQEFSVPTNQNVARAILDLDAQGLPHNAAAVTEELRRRPLLEEIGNGGSDLPTRERAFLLKAMSPAGRQEALAKLIDIGPAAFSRENAPIAEVIIDQAAMGLPTHRIAVQAELDSRGAGITVPSYQPPPVVNTQLPGHLDPQRMPRHMDPSTVGLGAWERVRLTTAVRAPLAAQQIRTYTRQDRFLAAARRAVTQYSRAVEHDSIGIVTDRLGDATLDLAQELVSVPKSLDPPSALPYSTDLAMPKPPQLSAAAQRTLRG